VTVDSNVVAFPDPGAAQRAADQVEAAREMHLAAFRFWLDVAQPSRCDAEMEAEVFASTARQMAALYARSPGA